MKKILALALAATTAFSMFGTSLSASAVDYMDETAFLDDYNATSVTITADQITVTQPVAVLDAQGRVTEVKNETYTITERQDLLNFAQHLIIGDPSSTPQSYEAWKEWNPGAADMRYGNIYMYDYADDKSTVNDDSYESALNAFADYVAQLQNPEKNATYTVERLYSYWRDAYRTSPETGLDSVSNNRWSVINEARQNANDVLDYMTYDSNNASIPDEGLFDPSDYADYNVDPLLRAVYALRNTSSMANLQTSRIVYINREYERVMSEVAFADTTTVMDEYYELLDQISEYVESDYTASAWREVQSYVEQAEAAAEEATTLNDWQDAIRYLERADAVSAKAVDYADLQRALMNLFVDDNGTSKVSYIKRPDAKDAPYNYSGLDADNCLYLKEDFKVRNGYSDEWNDFAYDTISMNSSNNPVIEEYSAYSWAAKLYFDARNSTGNAKQSQVDKALEDLNAAVDALTATEGVAEWRIVKLQASVDKAASFQESDFNTTSKRWETLVNALDSAEAVLAKSNPAPSEVDRVTNTLDEAISDVMTSAKSVPSATKEELRDVIREADKLIANVTTQTGAQVSALREASDDAADVYSRIGISGTDKAVISEVEAAIADLQKAIVNFNNPQGWNQVDGKWYYGNGAENYAGDWYKIGATWFMFNEDGTLKVNEWFQRDGKWYWANANGGLAVGWAKVDGKWYYFKGDNHMKTGWEKVNGTWYYLSSSGAMVTGWNWINGKCYYFYSNGAMAANTTVNGYRVDASGAWVA